LTDVEITCSNGNYKNQQESEMKIMDEFIMLQQEQTVSGGTPTVYKKISFCLA